MEIEIVLAKIAFKKVFETLKIPNKIISKIYYRKLYDSHLHFLERIISRVWYKTDEFEFKFLLPSEYNYYDPAILFRSPTKK